MRTSITDCRMKPTPFVTMLSMSFIRTERKNSNVSAAQSISTKSTDGVLLVTPDISAKNEGRVPACKVMIASHPNVPAEILWILVVKKSFTALRPIANPLRSLSVRDSIKDVFADGCDFGVGPVWLDVGCVVEDCIF